MRHPCTVVLRAGLALALVLAPLPPPAHAADLDATLEAMQRELGEGFRFQAAEPFAIAGNADAALWRQCLGTMQGCAAAFHKDFFTRRPDYPIRVYLFADEESYVKFARQTTGKAPVSKFGFYLPAREMLIMNISTGTGTLVHEMAHALMRPDFPAVPAWFNEGFASLFEQCQVVDGSLRGLVNWRFPTVRDAVGTGDWVPLERLVALSDDDFYGDGKELHYSEARYLCMFLQERKLLARYYREFRDGHEKDPTGRATLEAVTGKPLGDVEADWVAWLKTVKYR